MATSTSRKVTNIIWGVLALWIVLLIIGRIRNRPPTSVRGPLKILTPPFTANKAELIQDLRDRKFQALDAKLNSYQQSFEANILEEANLAVAFDAFAFADPALGPILDDWVKLEPMSYPAHLARAKYRAELGWQARGNRYANETSEQQMNEMVSRLSEAAAEAVTAIKLNSKSSIAYALLLDVAKAEGDDKSLDHVYSVGIASVPLSYSIRVSAMEALEPRWGGSYAMMTSLANDAQKSVSKNPRLASLKGFADVDRGNVAWSAGDQKGAIRLFDQALDEGGDFALGYSARGNFYVGIRQDNQALDDLNRANLIRPQNPETIAYIAYAYYGLDRPKDVLAMIQQYRQIAQPGPYMLKVEQWAQNFNTGNAVAVKVGGN